ncbi:uncharacterized protein B0H18DRAFT_79890 [Fomitopsis serialis]|uniref:uncharacterized protein n=1 Tax=Fomitopsis serialis TaxID=139415 RepID=UPI0020078F97|nr:uncharacterized protein B0H18DRAFT_79890 [Neoantrodia serialis]KAH9915898.1 hypothetical protein B0H18DRAFT_79890 [Neoantrodia serialis]
MLTIRQEVSRLSATGDSATKAGASTQIPYSKGTQMFRSFMDRMRALPAPPVTVDLSTVLPVKLPPGSRRVSDCFHEGISQFPRLTVNDACMWLPDSQHALRVVPGFGYDSRPRCRKWTPYVPRSATYIPKGTFELFHTHDDDLYYVGTYKTVEGPRDIHLKVIDTRLLAQLDGTVVVDDLEEALTWQTAPKAPPTNAVARTIPEMYEMGILRVQVIGLQCVGFNHRLHEELHPKRMPSDDTSRKSDTDVQRRRGSSAKRRSVSWLDALSSDDSIVLSDGEPPSKRQRSHTGAEMSDRDPSSSTLYPDHSDPVTPS